MGKLKKEYRCVLDLAHDIIGGKWKLRILWNIERAIPEITQKMRASIQRSQPPKRVALLYLWP